MRLVKVGVAAIDQTPFDWRGNERRIVEVLREASRERVTLLCLPELCITGYGCEDMFSSPSLLDRAAHILRERIAPATKGMIASVGLPVFHLGALYNCAALLVDGAIVGLSAKQFLAGDGIHYEPRWFKPWPNGVRTTTELAGLELPIGDLIYGVGGMRIGFEVCEDAWVANRPGSRLALAGVDVVLNPSASHFAFGKQEVRRRFVLEGSRAFGVAYLYANLLGNEAGRAIYDGGTVIAQTGKILVEGTRFSFREHVLTTAVIDIDHTRSMRARLPSFVPDVKLEPGVLVSRPFTYPPATPEPPVGVLAAWETSPHLKEEEFLRAEALALFDYLRKSRSQGYVVSLSGGADSAAVVCLVRIMVELVTREIGIDGLKERLSYVGGLAPLGTVEDITRRLLTTAYQATANSGETTRNAARVVAGAAYAEHHELDVDAIVVAYRTLIEGALGRELTWKDDDVALQNIQARVRAPSIWMIANLKNALLCATSNRSEAAVGYTTMDGDTCGGISPIAGIDKAFLREWLRFMEKEGPIGLAPMPELAAVNALAPTAELRPSSAKQTDEDDLMPYPILDAIERLAIRDKKDPVDCFRILERRFPEADRATLRVWVKRFFLLWCKNQWKRERYAPSFHLDDENLDPKTWCRFPILSGGFEVELAELDALRID